MTTAPKTLIAGNWKMNGLREQLDEIKAVANGVANTNNADVAICPPATLAGDASTVLKGTNVELGGQDCHAEVKGAFTGDVSAQMWKDIGARYVIVGHSERRAAYSETDEIVRAKAQSAMDAGLIPIICIGESLDERESGQTLDILGRQLEGSIPEEGKSKPFVVAYEPIWAIGTGLTPTLEQINDAHAFMRHTLSAIVEDAADKTPLLYGGSVKPANASEILAIQDVNGALVGGASLKASDFLGIINAA